jgi:pyruvate,water dikinase
MGGDGSTSLMDGRLIEVMSAPLDGRLGGKSFGLRWLADRGYRVPATWVLSEPQRDEPDTARLLRSIIRPDRSYAIRSCANVEDGGRVSYAGQFTSVLGVQGLDSVCAAVSDVLASADSGGVAAYRRHQHDGRALTMSVIIQEMVKPVVSGVAFSKNPITGLNETVIEAVEGSGERLQTEGVTPARWVHRWGDIVERPEAAILNDDLIRRIVGEVADIAGAMSVPVDTEWVYDGTDVWWVQVRGIGGIDEVTIYSRRIAKEVLPGLVKPLVWSINVPMVNKAWLDLLEDAVGELGLQPEELAHPFGYRAYFNMTAIGGVFEALGMPRESLELLLGLPSGSEQPSFKPGPETIRKLPRMTVLGARIARYGRTVDRELPILESLYRFFATKDLEALPTDHLVEDIELLRHVGVDAARMNVITPLLANAYASIFRSQLGVHGIDGSEVAVGVDDGAAFDPNPYLDELGSSLAAADGTIGGNGEVRYGDLNPAQRDEVDRFLARFGHFSDSGNDFSVPTWRDSPDTVVRMALRRDGQTTRADRLTLNDVESQIPKWKRPLVHQLGRSAAAFGERRDAVSSTYTFGYGLFRDYFLELGKRLTEAGVFRDADDIMYLAIDEVYAALDDGHDRSDMVQNRRSEMEDAADYDMPDLIYGDDFVPSRSVTSDRGVWTGTPTARGHHRGVARIVRGIEDLDKVSPGDVLVIPFSDVGWTPLFARAGAVVAESGGMLSHSSIIAREYGLPCVVSVEGALGIPDGGTIAVDGYRGTITLEEQE